jgi:hypothetical protein
VTWNTITSQSSQQLRDRGQALAVQYGLPWNFIDLQFQQESGWEHYDARGNVKLGPMTQYGQAIGVSQLLDSTAKSLGVDPRDPNQNLLGGIRYDKAMFDRYNGDLPRMFAAYDWGPGRVDKWDGNPNNLPQETRHYLDVILGPSWPSGQYGPNPTPGKPPGGITVPIPGPGNDIHIDFPEFPHVPTAQEIGSGIWGAFSGGVSSLLHSMVAGGRDVAIDRLSPWVLAWAGIFMISFGLLIGAIRTDTGQRALSITGNATGPVGRTYTGAVRQL